MKQLCSRQQDPYNTVVLDIQLGWRSPWLHPVETEQRMTTSVPRFGWRLYGVTFGVRAGVRAAGYLRVGHQSPA